MANELYPRTTASSKAEGRLKFDLSARKKKLGLDKPTGLANAATKVTNLTALESIKRNIAKKALSGQGGCGKKK